MDSFQKITFFCTALGPKNSQLHHIFNVVQVDLQTVDVVTFSC